MIGSIGEAQIFYQFKLLWNDVEHICYAFKVKMDQNAHITLRCLFGMLVSFIFFLIIRAFLMKLLLPWLKKKHNDVSGELALLFSRFSMLILWACIFVIMRNSINMAELPGIIPIIFSKLFAILFFLTLLGIVLHIVRFIMRAATNYILKKDTETYAKDKLLLDLTHSIIRLVICCLIIMVILQKILEFDVTHILVSAGIIGMGIAFAAQNTIANVFGAFAILGGNLFKVGDWIKNGDFEGVVERIGFRSVRIRDGSGRSIDVPNRLISDSTLENFSSRIYWREHFCFGLVYQTTPEQIDRALQIINEIGVELADLLVEDKKPKFVFLKCNDYSLDLDGYVWFKNFPDRYAMREAVSKFNKTVFKRFNEAGLSFAYPTRTVFVEKEQNSPQPSCTPIASEKE